MVFGMTTAIRAAGWRGVIEAYSDLIGLPAGCRPVTLYEGGTPLVPAPGLAKAAGLDVDVRLKLEALNPTGSFKDRGMTVAVSAAIHSGAKLIVCASTGNTAASAAAFAARAGIACAVVVPEGRWRWARWLRRAHTAPGS